MKKGLMVLAVAVSKSQAPATDTVVVTAVPASGYELEYVVVNGASIGKAGSFGMPAQNTTVQAHFKQSGYVLFDPANGITGGWRAARKKSTSEPGDSSDLDIEAILPVDGIFRLVQSNTGEQGYRTHSTRGEMWLEEDIDLSLYSTMYIEAATSNSLGSDGAELSLSQFYKR